MLLLSFYSHAIFNIFFNHGIIMKLAQKMFAGLQSDKLKLNINKFTFKIVNKKDSNPLASFKANLN